MRKTTSDLLHNPFRNRFNDPVTWRLDEMQAHSNVVWQKTHEKHDRPQAALDRSEGSSSASGEATFASVFAFVLVLLASAVVLFRF
jgi:hypothetical protein